MDIIFISGETVNLCTPIEEDFCQWASWFNDKKTTRFLEQGKYPNTVELQKEFYKNALDAGRLILMIKTKSMKLLGVISLSEIDYEKSRCQIALVCPKKSRSAPLGALEAMSLVTDHAFQRLGLARLWAVLAFPGNKSLTKFLEVIGYKAEGFHRNSFKHGIVEGDFVLISIVKQDYLKLKARRKDVLWPGTEVARKMIAAMKSSPSLAEELYEVINTRYSNFDNRLGEIEKGIRLKSKK